MGDISKFIQEQANNAGGGEAKPRTPRPEKVELSELGQQFLAEMQGVVPKMSVAISRPEALLVVRKLTQQVRRAYSSSADVKKKRLQDQIARLQKKLGDM